jgi:hypothetical protein
MRQFVRRNLQPKRQHGAESTTLQPRPWPGAVQVDCSVEPQSPTVHFDIRAQPNQEIAASITDVAEEPYHSENWTTRATLATSATSIDYYPSVQDTKLAKREHDAEHHPRIPPRVEICQVGSRNLTSSDWSWIRPLPPYSRKTAINAPLPLLRSPSSPPTGVPTSQSCLRETTAVDLPPAAFVPGKKQNNLPVPALLLTTPFNTALYPVDQTSQR